MNEFLLLLEEKQAQAESQAKMMYHLIGEPPKGVHLVVRQKGYFWALIIVWSSESHDASKWAARCWQIIRDQSQTCKQFCEDNPLSDFGSGIELLKRAKQLAEEKKKKSRAFGIARRLAK